ncbi:MAG: hypothetical protein LBU68_02630, partial [Rickettsiales bacterium]|nr:hypothetical protein [Rickettsiales bacterium]
SENIETEQSIAPKTVNHFSTLKIVCGTGTYVRTIAHDISEKLGTYGHLTKLVRIQNGKFSSENAVFLEKFLAFFESLQHNMYTKVIGKPDSFVQYDDVRIAEFLKPIDYQLDDIPVIIIDPIDTAKFAKGACFSSDNQNGFYKIYSMQKSDSLCKNESFFVGFAIVENKILQPKKVINTFDRKTDVNKNLTTKL